MADELDPNNADPDQQEEIGNAQEESEDSSPASLGDFDFVADPGPAFDAGVWDEGAAVRAEERSYQDDPDDKQQADDEEPEWSPKLVRRVAKGQGSLTHRVVGKTDQDWLWLDDELESLVEPAATILNEYEFTRMLARYANQIAAGEALIAYTSRSYEETHRANVAKKEAEEKADEWAKQFGTQSQPSQSPNRTAPLEVTI